MNPENTMPGRPAGKSPGKKSPRKTTGSAKLMRKVTRKTLDNGLRVFLVESHELPVVSHMIWYAVGARDERTGETGLSHFLEHMMFKGTDRYPKGTIDLTTARLGGNNNAFTDQDCTAYYFNLKSDRWGEALEIEASRMRGCLLDDAEFDAEKQVVLNELMMGEDEPVRPLMQAVEATAYQVHPYHHPVIGWREDLERLNRDDMLAYYQRHYTPDRAVLVVVGDLRAKDALAEIEDKLGSIPASNTPRPERLAEPQQRGERRIVVRFPGNMPRLAIAWHTCRVGEVEDPILDVVSYLLSAGKTGRFYRTIIQGRELATSADSYNDARLDPGLFWVLAEGKPKTRPEALEAAIFEEMETLAKKGPTAAELRRVKKQILTSFYFDLETVGSQAMRIGRHEVSSTEGYRSFEKYPKHLEAITAADIKRVMRQYLTKDNRTVGWSLRMIEAKDA